MRQTLATVIPLAFLISITVPLSGHARIAQYDSFELNVTLANGGNKHRAFSEPIVIADGLEVTYYWIPPRIPESRLYGNKTFQVLGELRNTTESDLDAPAIRFSLYDKEGNVLGSIVGLPLFHVIPSGTVMPFRGEEYDERLDIKEIASVELALCGTWGDTFYLDQGYGLANVEITDFRAHESSLSRLEIDGNILNNGPFDAYIRVQAAVFDRAGRYLGSTDAYTGAPVPPGKTGRFTIDARPGTRSAPSPLDYQREDYFVELWAGIDDQIWTYSC